MKTIERHYVKFFSPGTFMSETTVHPIDSWDTRKAVEMAERVVERYGAKPYGFTFLTMLEAEPVGDGRGGKLKVEPRCLRTSGMHHLGGKIETLDEVEARNSPKENILRLNMAGNGYWIVCVTTNSYRSVQPFDEKDVLVGPTGDVVERGDDPKHVTYRAARQAARDAEIATLTSGTPAKEG